MKKIALLLVAAMLALTIVGCSDVTKVSLTDEAIDSKGPSLGDLVGTWSSTEVNSYIEKTVSTTVTNKADNIVVTRIPVSNNNYSLVIAEGATKNDPYTYTYTYTEVLADPGMLISTVDTTTTAGITTTVSTYYSTIVSAGTSGILSDVNSYYVGDSSGRANGATATWLSTDGLDDFVLEDSRTTALVPTAVAFSGNNEVTTRTGTITESEGYDSSLGRTVNMYAFVDTTKSYEGLVGTLLDQGTATPIWNYNTYTEQNALDSDLLSSEGSFVYLPETETWSITGGNFNGLTLAVEE